MAFQVFSPLSLFLLGLMLFSGPIGVAGMVALPVPEGLVWQQRKYFQAPADTEKNEFLVLLSGLAERASHVNISHLSRQEKIAVSPQEESAPVPQPPARGRAACKNFFWKTFSSC